MQDQLGPTDFFDGAMGAVINRKVKVIKVIEQAVFTSLAMQFPAGETGAANPSTMTFPALCEIRDVESFRLASGSIQVIYAGNIPT